MSDLAFFEYATVIPPIGNQREGTPAHYLVEVLIRDSVTQEERVPAELKRIANDCLSLTLDAQKLKKVRRAGSGYDSWAFLVE
jgi:hypothetical protein